MEKRCITSESVTEGHPDKLCDRVADAILDAYLSSDPYARVACEVMITQNTIVIAGQVSTLCTVNCAEVARTAIRQAGYDNPATGFDVDNCAVMVELHRQSSDIAQGVDHSTEARAGSQDQADKMGAGDQGIMFGFACDETPERMPLPTALANCLCRQLSMVRKAGLLPWLRPDGKSLVTVEYDKNWQAQRCSTIVVAAQHDPDIETAQLRKAVMEHVILPVVPSRYIDKDTAILINMTGLFVIGGPCADSGLTGRKIVADAYGGAAPHGGGCFSGKDPSKMDRTGAYMARYVAKNLVEAGLARRCTVSLAYVIGVAAPVTVGVETQGTGIVSDELLAEYVRATFDLRPAEIIRKFELCRPIYASTSAYGHFGRKDLDLPWERTDAAERICQVIQGKGRDVRCR